MDNNNLSFDHIHIISPDPDAAARWYEDVLGARIASNHEVRGAAQINVRLAGMSLLIRGQRPGETPGSVNPCSSFPITPAIITGEPIILDTHTKVIYMPGAKNSKPGAPHSP